MRSLLALPLALPLAVPVPCRRRYEQEPLDGGKRRGVLMDEFISKFCS